MFKQTRLAILLRVEGYKTVFCWAKKETLLQEFTTLINQSIGSLLPAETVLDIRSFEPTFYILFFFYYTPLPLAFILKFRAVYSPDKIYRASKVYTHTHTRTKTHICSVYS